MRVASSICSSYSSVACAYRAYKYNSSLSGIGAHADPAAVNVNLWLTPDASNLDPDRGGRAL